jgi:hypothetical protein
MGAGSSAGAAYAAENLAAPDSRWSLTAAISQRRPTRFDSARQAARCRSPMPSSRRAGTGSSAPSTRNKLNQRPDLQLEGIAELANVPGDALTQPEIDDEAISLLEEGYIDGDVTSQRFAPRRAKLTALGSDPAAELWVRDGGLLY